MKRILIVDDEESILMVLKKSLTLLGEDYQVDTATSGEEAINHLHQSNFDLVITDYLMAGLDGLELMAEVRVLQPNARIIMVSAYGTDELETEANGLQVYRYIEKPIEIDKFRRVVQEALGGDSQLISPANQTAEPAQLPFEHIDLLLQLQQEVSARCVLVADKAGHILAQTGDLNELKTDVLTKSLTEGFDKLLQAGCTIDNDFEAVNLAYRESKLHNLYAVSVGQDFLLVLVIDRGDYSNRLGTVWFYARQTGVALKKHLIASDSRPYKKSSK
ncbi:MAG TPA: response regulator [Anaerolineaceae bacterium]|nr:response regulator [Anaerolineaceae bacterium]